MILAVMLLSLLTVVAVAYVLRHMSEAIEQIQRELRE